MSIYQSFFRPLRKVHSPTECLNDTVSPLIVHLFLGGSPADIARLIVPININPIQGVLAGGWVSDMGIERLKPVIPPPFITDVNPPTPVVWILLTFGVVDAVPHAKPSIVNLGFGHPVFAMGFRVSLTTIATAGLGMSIQYITGSSDGLAATVANELPALLINALNSGEAAKPLACDIEQRHIQSEFSLASNTVSRLLISEASKAAEYP